MPPCQSLCAPWSLLWPCSGQHWARATRRSRRQTRTSPRTAIRHPPRTIPAERRRGGRLGRKARLGWHSLCARQPRRCRSSPQKSPVRGRRAQHRGHCRQQSRVLCLEAEAEDDSCLPHGGRLDSGAALATACRAKKTAKTPADKKKTGSATLSATVPYSSCYRLHPLRAGQVLSGYETS
eukprot:scaffold11136_cov66-Phaeocystis_antarctica.AAC.6